MIDIYTKRRIVTPSEEHIILNAFGGRRTAPLIDKSTNDVFGHSIDAPLAADLQIVRVLLDARSGEGRSPPPFRGVRGADGESYDLMAGGRAELGRPRLEVSDGDDGKVWVTGRVRTLREIERLVARPLARRGISLERLREQMSELEIAETRTPAPLVRFKVAFGGEAWRAIAKMACNLLALSRRELFLSPAFDGVRAFILDGGEPWPFVALDVATTDIGTCLGPLDHLVVVSGDARTGEVRGLVSLFKHFQFCVAMGTTPLEQSFRITYRVDQLSGRDRLDDPEDRLDVPAFQSLLEVGESRWFDVTEAAWNDVLRKAHGLRPDDVARDLIRAAIEEVWGPPGSRAIAREDVAALARRIAEDYVGLLVQRGQLESDDESS